MGNVFEAIEKITQDIIEQQNYAKAMEFANVIGKMLRENGVVANVTEYASLLPSLDIDEQIYKFTIDSLDFSEHDKVFVDEINALKKECVTLHKQLMETERDMQAEIERLKKEKCDLVVALHTMRTKLNDEIKHLQGRNAELRDLLDKLVARK